jgi:hypothetical protein
MADPKDKAADKPDAEAPKTTPDSGQQAQQQPVQVEVDDTGLISLYANFCRVTGTPEELIIDFALNPQPMGAPIKPISVKQRALVPFEKPVINHARRIVTLNAAGKRRFTSGVSPTGAQGQPVGPFSPSYQRVRKAIPESTRICS